MAHQKKLSSEELAAFCSQISILIHAGIPPIESIRVLSADTQDVSIRKLLEEITHNIEAGDSFSESLDKAGVFPEYVINTLSLGEEAGSIDEVMRSLADFYEREAKISEGIKSAVTYPLVMIVMMLTVIILLITKVLPIFNQVYIQLGAEMTGFAASLLNFGNTLSKYSIVFIIVLLLILALFVFFTRTGAGRRSSRRLLGSMALTRKFYEDIATERFSSGMALALSAGLDTFRGLDMVRKLVEHKRTQAKIDICKASIEKGDNFAEALKASEIYSNVNTRMVAVGFKSGEIEQVMHRIADEYQRKSEKKINEILSIIEPTLVIILSVIVGLILLSVILPLMGVMSTIG